MLLAAGTLRSGMYPAGKVAISWHLATPRFPQSDHTVSKLSADNGSLWNTVKQTSRPQVILKTQPLICLDYRARNRPQLFPVLHSCLFVTEPILYSITVGSRQMKFDQSSILVFLTPRPMFIISPLFRAAIVGNTGKTAVLPRCYGKEHGTRAMSGTVVLSV